MSRLEEYCALLGNIYGERIVKLFTSKNENAFTLTMNNEENNQKAKKDYDREKGEGCKTCKDKFRNENNKNFFKRNLEFPGWIEYLNFSGTIPAKEIMIIGVEPPPLKDQINISFGLGLYPIQNDGKLNIQGLGKNELWEYINQLFLGKLDVIKQKIYITDLCKCNDHTEKKEMWSKCLTKCLIEEIKLINPKLIIFQGWDSYKYLMNFLFHKGLREEPDFSKNLSDDPHYDMLCFNQKEIHFFTIIHQASFRYMKKEEKSEYITRMQKFIETQIYRGILNY